MCFRSGLGLELRFDTGRGLRTGLMGLRVTVVFRGLGLEISIKQASVSGFKAWGFVEEALKSANPKA